jgi:hypothetical protein
MPTKLCVLARFLQFMAYSVPQSMNNSRRVKAMCQSHQQACTRALQNYTKTSCLPALHSESLQDNLPHRIQKSTTPTQKRTPVTSSMRYADSHGQPNGCMIYSKYYCATSPKVPSTLSLPPPLQQHLLTHAPTPPITSSKLLLVNSNPLCPTKTLPANTCCCSVLSLAVRQAVPLSTPLFSFHSSRSSLCTQSLKACCFRGHASDTPAVSP